MTTRWTLTARWVFPVETPPLERGLVTIAGERIAAVEPHGTRHADVDLGNVAVLPGFVNAHTHLDLSGMRGLSPPSLDFSGWLRQVIAFRRERSPEQIRADLQTGIAECLRFGTTLIGDVSGDGGSWVFLANNSLRAVVFREFLGLPKDRASGALDRLIRWHDSQIETTTCRRGVSPHAPYSVRSSLFYAASIIGVPV